MILDFAIAYTLMKEWVFFLKKLKALTKVGTTIMKINQLWLNTTPNFKLNPQTITIVHH
jgi:hypothetical protein